jgi:hypothetical protein
MAQKRAEGGVAKPPGANQYKKELRVAEKPEAPQTLADQGIDKNLAARARRLAAVAEADFEATLDEHREEQKAVTARTFAKLEETAQDAPNRIWRTWYPQLRGQRLSVTPRFY